MIHTHAINWDALPLLLMCVPIEVYFYICVCICVYICICICICICNTCIQNMIRVVAVLGVKYQYVHINIYV